jgi:hypothetical protein
MMRFQSADIYYSCYLRTVPSEKPRIKSLNPNALEPG